MIITSVFVDFARKKTLRIQIANRNVTLFLLLSMAHGKNVSKIWVPSREEKSE